MQHSIFIFLVTSISAFGQRFTSTTYIEPYKTFVLGENQHGKFDTWVKNSSDELIYIYSKDSSNNQQKVTILKPNTKEHLFNDANSALYFENRSQKQVAIHLKINGDVGLSMDYQNNEKP